MRPPDIERRRRRAAGYGPQSYARQIWTVIKYAIGQKTAAMKRRRKRDTPT